MIDILAFGDAVIDMQINIDTDKFAALAIEQSRSNIISSQRMQQLITDNPNLLVYSGGSAANTIYTSTILGSSCALAGNIGQDVSAQRFLKDLGNIQHYAITKTKQTTQCVVFIESDGERTFAAYLPNDRTTMKSQLPQAKLSFIEGYMLYNHSYQKLKSHLSGIVVLSLSDCNLIDTMRSELDQWVSISDIIIGNEQEFFTLVQNTSVAECLNASMFYGKILILTRSKQGCIVRDRDNTSIQIPSIRAKQTLNSNGAGDAFSGAFLHSFLQHNNLSKAAQLGTKAGCLAVQQDSARLTEDVLLTLSNE